MQIDITNAFAYKFRVNGDRKWWVYCQRGMQLLLSCVFVWLSEFAWSLGHISWMLPSEIFSLEVRFSAQKINVSVSMICTFAIAQIFTTMLCQMKFVLFIFSAFFVVVITASFYQRPRSSSWRNVNCIGEASLLEWIHESGSQRTRLRAILDYLVLSLFIFIFIGFLVYFLIG